MGTSSCATFCPSACPRRVAFACLLSLLLLPFLVAGCQGKSDANAALQITDDQQIQNATERGKKLWGGDPYAAYQKTTQNLNVRISENVIWRSAAICTPQEEVAFTVASLPAVTDDTAIKQAVDDSIRKINEQVKFVVVLQMLKGYDPKKVEFELRTNTGQTYPPTAVEAPQLIQETPGSKEEDVPAEDIYGYDIYFQTIGSPGYPPIDAGVTSVTLVVKDSGAQAEANFSLYNTPGQ